LQSTSGLEADTVFFLAHLLVHFAKSCINRGCYIPAARSSAIMISLVSNCPHLQLYGHSHLFAHTAVLLLAVCKCCKVCGSSGWGGCRGASVWWCRDFSLFNLDTTASAVDIREEKEEIKEVRAIVQACHQLVPQVVEDLPYWLSMLNVMLN